jgi:ubiquitin-protein ligase
MSKVRLRRLQSDHDKLVELARRHPRLNLVQAQGDPPERYQIEYRVKGLRQKDDQLEVVQSHLVEISLPVDYPRSPPLCRMLTPVFHPNIAPHAICIGDHWSAGEPLASIVARIGEMIAFQSYNTKSPLNGEAAKWTDENIERLPLDPVNMIPEEPVASAMRSEARPAAPPMPESLAPPPPAAPAIQVEALFKAPAVDTAAPAADAMQPQPEETERKVSFRCPGCGKGLRIGPERFGKRVRCPNCRTISIGPEG